MPGATAPMALSTVDSGRDSGCDSGLAVRDSGPAVGGYHAQRLSLGGDDHLLGSVLGSSHVLPRSGHPISRRPRPAARRYGSAGIRRTKHTPPRRSELADHGTGSWAGRKSPSPKLLE